jgi:hypothetical protein
MNTIRPLRPHPIPEVTTPLTPNAPILEIVPDELENRIDIQVLILYTAETPAERRAAWDELTRLHAMRSPARIGQMEKSAGLR